MIGYMGTLASTEASASIPGEDVPRLCSTLHPESDRQLHLNIFALIDFPIYHFCIILSVLVLCFTMAMLY